MKKSLKKSIKKIYENTFLKFFLQLLKSPIHLGKVTLDQTLIPSFPSPHQLCRWKNKRTNIEGLSRPGAAGPYVLTSKCDNILELGFLILDLWFHKQNVYKVNLFIFSIVKIGSGKKTSHKYHKMTIIKKTQALRTFFDQRIFFIFN